MEYSILDLMNSTRYIVYCTDVPGTVPFGTVQGAATGTEPFKYGRYRTEYDCTVVNHAESTWTSSQVFITSLFALPLYD